MPNGLSIVEVILKLGPEAGSDTISSLQTSIKENDGELELSNGASAKLVSVKTLNPGMLINNGHLANTKPKCHDNHFRFAVFSFKMPNKENPYMPRNYTQPA